MDGLDALKLTYVRGPQRMNLIDFGDPLTFLSFIQIMYLSIKVDICGGFSKMSEQLFDGFQ